MKPWVRVDVDILRHPKVIGLSPRAKLAFVGSILLAHEQNRDGLIVNAAIKSLADKKVRNELVDGELWHNEDGGIRVHDYLNYQESREQREARSAAGRKAAEARWGHTNGNANRIANRNAPRQDNDQDQDVETRSEGLVSIQSSALDSEEPDFVNQHAAITLLKAIKDRDESTDLAVHAVAVGAPEAAFVHALEKLNERRKRQPPLDSESRYVGRVLGNWIKENG